MYFPQTLTYGRRDLETACLADDMLFLNVLYCIAYVYFFGYLNNLKRQMMTSVYKNNKFLILFQYLEVH